MAAPEAIEPSSISDEALVQQVLEGDRAAFEILYERYFPRVFRFVARRVSNRADAEEIVQEIFINVYSSIGGYRGEAPLAAWVLGLSRRTVANRFKKKRHPTVPLEEEQGFDAVDRASNLKREATPLEHYECRERAALIQHAANTRLSAEQRELFEMHHLRHHSIQDIARALRKSEDSVKSNLYRARKVLIAR
jgi:RNA polymerase sigma-70 factor (ECF subfamily)